MHAFKHVYTQNIHSYTRACAVCVQVYAILHSHTSKVQALSCDEAFLDVSGLGDPDAIALAIREEIRAATACPASAGIAENLLLARLATRKAKPDGQYRVRQQDVSSGVGYRFLLYNPLMGKIVNHCVRTA